MSCCIFVEFMSAHPDRAAEYEKLKIELSNKYKEEPEKYSQGKSVFIKTMDSEAIIKGLKIVATSSAKKIAAKCQHE